MTDNIVKKSIKKYARSIIIKNLLFLIPAVFILFILKNGFFVLINQYKSATSVYEAEQLAKSTEFFIKIKADKIYDTGLRQRTRDKILSNYICAEFADGILIVDIPHSKYLKLDFDAENIVLKGNISSDGKLIRDELAVEFEYNADKYPDELVTQKIAECILDDTVFIFKPLFAGVFLLFSYFFIIFIIPVIKNFVNLIDYKKSKTYRFLEKFDFNSSEEAEDAINRDFNENQDNFIFKNQNIFVSERFIIMLSPPAFYDKNDLNRAEEYGMSAKNEAKYYVKLKFNSFSESVKIQVAGDSEMKKIISVLRGNMFGGENRD